VKLITHASAGQAPRIIPGGTRPGQARTQAQVLSGSDVQLTGTALPASAAPAASGGGMGIALLAAAGVGAAFFLTRRGR